MKNVGRGLGLQQEIAIENSQEDNVVLVMRSKSPTNLVSSNTRREN